PVSVIELIDKAVITGSNACLINFAAVINIIAPEFCILAKLIKSVICIWMFGGIEIVETILPIFPGFFAVAIDIAEIAGTYFINVIVVLCQITGTGIGFPLVISVLIHYVDV